MGIEGVISQVCLRIVRVRFVRSPLGASRVIRRAARDFSLYIELESRIVYPKE